MTNPFDPGYYGSDELRGFGFKAVGENVAISRACNIVGLARIEIGDNVRIDAFTSIIAAGGSVSIGCHVHIGTSVFLGARGGIELQDFAGLSHGVRVFSASDDYSGRWMTNPTVPEELTGCTVAPVKLGRHVIVGANTVILPGVTIGEGSAVGAQALVRKPLDAWGVYSGAPVKRICARKRDLLGLAARLKDVHLAA